MSTKRPLNKKRMKAKKGPEPIITRHEREGNMNYFAEEITKSIVDKIISLTITRHFLNDLNPKLPLLCFNNIKREIENYIHCQFISHDRDDMSSFIRQPQFSSMTDFLRDSTITELEELHFDQKYEGLLYDNYFDGFNYWGDVLQPLSIIKDRNAATQINYVGKEPFKKKLEVVLDEQLKSEENAQSPPRMNQRNNYPSFKALVPIVLRDQPVATGKQKNPTASIVSYDLPPNEAEVIREEEEHIAQSRKEFFDNKDKERQEIEDAEKILQDKKDIKKEENKSQLKSVRIRKNVTNDADCKLVYIREVIPETLKNEFNMPKIESKDVVSIRDQKKDSVIVKNAAMIAKIKDSVRDNSEGGSIEHKNSNVSKLNVDRFFAVKPMFTSNLALQLNKEEITPGGSSFSLFSPEVGVSILENNQTKIGGKDYYRRYNKFSIENYNQKLRESLYLFQSSYFQREVYPQSNSDIDINNPGDMTSQISNFNHNMSSIFKQSFNNNSLMPSVLSKSRLKLKSNSSSDMKLNTSARFLSLRAAIDSLDLISEREGDLKQRQRFKNKEAANLFRKLTYRTINSKPKEEKQSFDEMDTFTKRISMNSFWGNQKINQIRNIPYKPIQRRMRQIKDNDSEGEMNITRASSLPRIRMKKNFNLSVFNFTQSPIDNLKRINLNKTKYFNKDFFKVY